MANVSGRNIIFPKIDRRKVIAGMGLLGGAILLLYGLMISRLYYYGTDESTVFRYINAIVTILWASMAIFSSVILLRGNKVGYTILLIAAIGGLIGNFIPIFSYDQGYGYIEIIYLNGTAYIDLVLMLIGGIYGVALPDKKERQEYK
ncbi:hypothetical protein LCGC14_1066180 [marine sediment metagenome]|uniref:Uncharacterized protein n=1 Tax=marine sediment metagenome TaxID=412755 RepID=A0A0F9QQF0_9ZZZZ|nr:hypothetical protein [archaeon]